MRVWESSGLDGRVGRSRVPVPRNSDCAAAMGLTSLRRRACSGDCACAGRSHIGCGERARCLSCGGGAALCAPPPHSSYARQRRGVAGRGSRVLTTATSTTAQGAVLPAPLRPWQALGRATLEVTVSPAIGGPASERRQPLSRVLAHRPRCCCRRAGHASQHYSPFVVASQSTALCQWCANARISSPLSQSACMSATTRAPVRCDRDPCSLLADRLAAREQTCVPAPAQHVAAIAVKSQLRSPRQQPSQAQRARRERALVVVPRHDGAADE